MEIRRTLTMNWEKLGDLDDEDGLFFDAQRLSTAVPQDPTSSSSDDEFDDSRMSFASATDFPDFLEFQNSEYDKWMAAPQSITDRRRRLHQDMGLGSSKNLSVFCSSTGALANARTPVEKDSSLVFVFEKQKHDEKMQCEPDTASGTHAILLRSSSDGSIDTFSIDTKRRKEEMIGSILNQRLIRTMSGFSAQIVGLSSPSNGQQRMTFIAKDDTSNKDEDDDSKSTVLLIKNLDNGKEFIVKECNNEENWNKLSDVKTGEQITMEEFEKNLGYSLKVKELMRKDSRNVSGDQKLTPGESSFHKSFRKSKKRGVALFKNIKLGSIGGSKSDKERTSLITGSLSINGNNPIMDQKSSSQWVKARVHGKPYKEFTALHMSQEIQGHDGSIWAMKFTSDGQYLASAGEDKVINIWEVLEFDVMGMVASPDGRPPLPDGMLEKKKKGRKKKGIPDYVHVPETVFGLSETPFCTLTGHVDDVLDLSWSKSRLLLSSSMDNTVRLWDIETKNCLKMFSHTDYVTCVQFNPVDDDYFISGSLDAKVRIWNIQDRHVVDWIDLNEMVTAVGYSIDGKVSVVGSNKGICRFYNTADCKLEFKEQVELKTKKKPQPKKITGFQFSTLNPSEVLVTSADSRVRILDGTKTVQKFKGYKNNNSQLSADYSPDGKYIISASEDSQVYIWRHEETKGKHKYPIVTSYEHFPCKEVSVAAPWPGSNKLEQPLVAIHSKKHSKRYTLPPPVNGSSPVSDDLGYSKPSSTPLPPLPKKSNPSTDSVEDIDHNANVDSSVGSSDSFSSAITSSGRFDEMTSPLPNRGHKTIQATAWGLVIVTAGLGGEIKVFQNVGLPFKVGRL